MLYRNMSIKYFLLYGLLLTFITANAQNLEKANLYYKAGEYAAALKIYESALASKPGNAIKTKVANCYRALNKPDKAELLYSEIVRSDQAKPIDFFHYGETLLTAGKYDEAKTWFQKYSALIPEDGKGKLMVIACSEVKNIRPYFKDLHLSNFDFNTEGDENSPVFFKNSLVFASDRPPGFKLLQQKDPSTGRDYIELWESEADDEGGWKEPRLLSSKLSSINKNTGNVSFTADGKYAFFSRNSDYESRAHAFNMQIYQAERTEAGRWKNIELLDFCTPENNYMHPAISPDGKTLFYIADRPQGLGGMDIYFSKRTSRGWTKPENLGPHVNTAAHEGFPFMSTDGKLYFCSKGRPGFGGFDIFFTERDSLTGEWKEAVNVGPPINSPYDDISLCLTADRSQGAFTSSRDGRGDDIFLFTLGVPPVKKTREPEADQLADSLVVKNDFTGPDAANKETGKEHISEKKPVEPDTIQKQAPKQERETEKIASGAPTASTENRPEAVQAIVIEPGTAVDTTKKQKPSVESSEEKTDTASGVSYFETMIGKIESKKLRVNQKFIMTGIDFDKSDSTALTLKAATELDKLADFLNDYKHLIVEIGAHTETAGDDQGNRTVSIMRAQAVTAYLKERGVKASRLTARGYGSMRPLKDCRTEDCKPEEDRKNKRFELKIKAL